MSQPDIIHTDTVIGMRVWWVITLIVVSSLAGCWVGHSAGVGDGYWNCLDDARQTRSQK